jgi:L-seryl-tRNA(Ser) seleniumtransferase
VVDACRRAIDEARRRLRADASLAPDAAVAGAVAAEALRLSLAPLQRVINATGVVLHTNLGRAPLDRAMVAQAAELASGATNLEIDLVSGERGTRGAFVRERLARLCGAEAALVVNNNAAAVLLALSALAAGREVVVSRGELVQIGGGFRVPDVIVQGGARLREVGTTNVTSPADVGAAVGPETGALLKVHLSNFRMLGFVQRPTIAQLAAHKRPDVPLVVDLGSGCLLPGFDPAALSGADDEVTPARALADGADLVCFSGDKLLGGPQAGVVAGRRDLVQRLAGHPLLRAIRPDKLVLAVLQAVVARYERREGDALAPWRYVAASREQQRAAAARILGAAGTDQARCPLVDSQGEYGSGSLPGVPVPSVAVQVTREQPDRAAAAFRHGTPPIVGVVREGAFLLDLLALEPRDEADVAAALSRFLAG